MWLVAGDWWLLVFSGADDRFLSSASSLHSPTTKNDGLPHLSLGACAGILRPLGSLRFLMSCLCMLVCSFGVLQRFPGVFVSGQVIFFSVMLGGSTVCVSGEHVKLSGFLM